ncbi:MAG: DUF58 domain-containing protein [Candidatus Aenigmarchaeota archaeon]|nr:DUF58 domain-containing protein [Candidatus Aenigmarchaeota archaeon]
MVRLNIEVVELAKKLEILIKILINTQVASKYRSVFKGQGLEFEDYRKYLTTDDAKIIDWKASIRANELMVKEFKEERNLNTYILLDTSYSMIFGSTEKLKAQYAAEVAASLSYFVLKSGDNVSMTMFNDKIAQFVPPDCGDKQFYLILNFLANADVYEAGYDLENAIDFVMKTMPRRGLLIIISDFIGLEGEWDKSLKVAGKKFDVLGIMVRDPRDNELIKTGNIVLQDPMSDELTIINTGKIKDKYSEYTKNEKKFIKETFSKSNADLLDLNTDEDFIKPIIQFLLRRGGRA